MTLSRETGIALCPTCDGTGECFANPSAPDPRGETSDPCPRCQGTGRAESWEDEALRLRADDAERWTVRAIAAHLGQNHTAVGRLIRRHAPTPRLTTEDRFFAKVCVAGDCWLWTGALNPNGYGLWHPSTDTAAGAHRVAYEMLVGPIPAGLQLDHLCRVRNCVNPDHLEPVTARENTLRGYAVTAGNARKTHCPKGHLYAGDNLRMYRGSRRCRACERERWGPRRAPRDSSRAAA